MSLVVPPTSARTQGAVAVTGLSSEAIGPAASMMAATSGTRMMTVQVSTAEVMPATRARASGSSAARSADRASTGTMALVSAPPTTSSYSRLGTWLAVT